VTTDGGFRGSKEFDGGLTGRRSAWVRMRDGSSTIVWHLHPARRRPVKQGLWRLRFSDGQTARFYVLAGGRVVDPTNYPNAALSQCGLAGGAPQAVEFVTAAGGVSATDPAHGLTFALTLRATSGQGVVTIANQTCPDTTVTMTATRVSSAQPKAGTLPDGRGPHDGEPGEVMFIAQRGASNG
jgi:hypothetical protein